MKDPIILVVEDNPGDQKLTLRALEANNILNEVVIAVDGAEALDYLFGRGPHQARDPALMPQMVLLDLKLPKVDGLEVLRQIRSDDRTRLLPVVTLTSSKEDRDIAEGYGLGANSYVRKPVGFGEFRNAVKQLGRYRLLLNVPPPTDGAQWPR